MAYPRRVQRRHNPLAEQRARHTYLPSPVSATTSLFCPTESHCSFHHVSLANAPLLLAHFALIVFQTRCPPHTTRSRVPSPSRSKATSSPRRRWARLPRSRYRATSCERHQPTLHCPSFLLRPAFRPWRRRTLLRKAVPRVLNTQNIDRTSCKTSAHSIPAERRLLFWRSHFIARKAPIHSSTPFHRHTAKEMRCKNIILYLFLRCSSLSLSPSIETKRENAPIDKLIQTTTPHDTT